MSEESEEKRDKILEADKFPVYGPQFRVETPTPPLVQRTVNVKCRTLTEMNGDERSPFRTL